MTTLTDTKATLQTAVALENKTLGYPLKGVHVGPGPHVPMPATWDGVGPVPPGWTAYSDKDIVPDTKGAYTTTLDDSFTAEKVAASTTLTPADKTAASTLLSKVVTVTAEVTK